MISHARDGVVLVGSLEAHFDGVLGSDRLDGILFNSCSRATGLPCPGHKPRRAGRKSLPRSCLCSGDGRPRKHGDMHAVERVQYGEITTFPRCQRARLVGYERRFAFKVKGKGIAIVISTGARCVLSRRAGRSDSFCVLSPLTHITELVATAPARLTPFTTLHHVLRRTFIRHYQRPSKPRPRRSIYQSAER